jgi:hypothetical protein
MNIDFIPFQTPNISLRARSTFPSDEYNFSEASSDSLSNLFSEFFLALLFMV